MMYRLKYESLKDAVLAKYPVTGIGGEEIGYAWMQPVKQLILGLAIGIVAHYTLDVKLTTAVMYGLMGSAVLMNVLPAKWLDVGGFEIYFLDDKEGSKPECIYSKHETGKLPTTEEVMAILAKRME